MKLNIKNIGLTSGLVWGSFLSFLTLIAILFPPYGQTFLETITSVYPGYSISLSGMIIGFFYGLIDAGLGGAFFAWLYNYISQKK